MKTVQTPDLLTKAGWAWHATIYFPANNKHDETFNIRASWCYCYYYFFSREILVLKHENAYLKKLYNKVSSLVKSSSCGFIR